ncbi:uncharacterized protein LOC119173450 [Rhipicephalus microplus]|uniref:uncharacterized protein LOC119173450 n=1 Tax=Rhipicephalus microplus TaxID=6941 RepID=UPI001889281E|nr:uncharacterized protein LOC119173450 [Rhipicephalus microplus]
MCTMSIGFVFGFAFLAAIATAVPLERRPELGQFQDESKCFPYEKPWFAMLRNFENDPYVGGTAKCIRVTQAAPLQGHVTENVVEFGHTHRARNRLTLTNTEGYQHKNALNVTFLEGPGKGSTIQLFNAYSDCDKCKIYRNPYAGENACTLFVPESQKNQIDPSCLFIFNLLCGGDKHYLLLDDSCTF